MITLGIIGVVAAITIPGLMTHFDKIRTVNQLKEVYSILTQGFKAASEENDLYTIGDNWNDRTAVIEALKPYIKFLDVYSGNASGQRPMCYDGSIKSYVKGSAQYGWLTTVGVSTPFSNKTSSAKLINGACVGFDLNAGTSRMVYVDVNGSQSRPNLIGKDLFFFSVKPDGSIIPTGYDLPYSTISANSGWGCNKKGGWGGYCAARIIRDGWQITYY